MKCPFCIKICTKCKRILVANEMNFGKKKCGKYGLNSQCKKCRKEYTKNNKKEISEYKKQYYKENKEYLKEYKRQYRENNKDKINEKYKQYYEENEEHLKEYRRQYYKNNKDKINEKHKEYYRNNKDEILKYGKQYYEDNKDKILEQCKRYYENNPEKRFNQSNKRRSREENQGRGITKEQWLEMMDFFDWKCAYSDEYIGGKENNFVRSIDHIISLSNGGLNEPWNCVPMLRNLNSSKSTNDMMNWYSQQVFFDIDRLLKIYEWIEYAWNKWGVNDD